MESGDAKKLKHLEEENRKLKHVVAERRNLLILLRGAPSLRRVRINSQLLCRSTLWCRCVRTARVDLPYTSGETPTSRASACQCRGCGRRLRARISAA
jgi:hypothetical protein